MRRLRLRVLGCLVEGPNHEYSIAKKLGENFTTVRKILISYEEKGIARFVSYGPRNAKRYEATEMGEKVYDIAKDVADNVKLVPKEELIGRYGKELVELAIRASLIEPMEREKSITKIGPDAPPSDFGDRVTIRRIIAEIRSRGNKRIRSMHLRCSRCGHVGPLPKSVIFPQAKAVASNLVKMLKFRCPECGATAEVVY